MGKKFFVGLFCLAFLGSAVSCNVNKQVDGSYDFIVYKMNSDWTSASPDFAKATEVSRYHIEFYQCKCVADTLRKDGDHYYLGTSSDYLLMNDSGYGLTYTRAFFAAYSAEEFDCSWSYTFVNKNLSLGISNDSMENIETYEFVINGWAQ